MRWSVAARRLSIVVQSYNVSKTDRARERNELTSRQYKQEEEVPLRQIDGRCCCCGGGEGGLRVVASPRQLDTCQCDNQERIDKMKNRKRLLSFVHRTTKLLTRNTMCSSVI